MANARKPVPTHNSLLFLIITATAKTATNRGITSRNGNSGTGRVGEALEVSENFTVWIGLQELTSPTTIGWLAL